MTGGIVVKELSGVARRWQTYLGRVVYVGLILLIVYQFLASRDLRSLNNPSELADLGRRIFLVFVPFQMLFVTLVGLSSASDMISKESRSGTLGLLTLTPLSPWGIVFGKWRAAMAYATSVIFCGVPVLAICVYLGGIGLVDLTWSTLLTLADAAFAAALGLLFSTFFRAGYVTILVGIVTIGAFLILPILMMAGAREEGALHFFIWTHPAFAAAAASVGDRYLKASEYGWTLAAPLTFLYAWFFLRRAAARLPNLAAAAPKPSLLIKTFESMDRFYEGVGPKAIRNVRIFAGTREVWQSGAMLWKELRTRASGKLRYATRIALGLLLLMILPASCSSSGFDRDWSYGTLMVGTLLLLFVGIANGVSLFVREKEARQWDVLLSTPLRASEIVDAKLKAGLVGLLPLGVVLAGFFLLLSWMGSMNGMDTLVAVGTVLLIVVFAYTLAGAASLRAATMRGAFAFTFGALSSLLLLLPLLCSFYDALPGVHWDRNAFPFVLVTLTNPVVILGEVVRIHRYSYGYWESSDHFGTIVGYALVYGLGTLALRAYMVRGFNRITGRSGEA